MEQEEDTLLLQREVEERLGLPKRSFTRLRSAGEKLPPRYRIGGRYYYRWKEVQAWLTSRKEG